MDTAEFRNSTCKCLGCNVLLIGHSFLCTACESKYPGVVGQAIEDVKQEDKEYDMEQKRQEMIQERRSQFRCI